MAPKKKKNNRRKNPKPPNLDLKSLADVITQLLPGSTRVQPIGIFTYGQMMQMLGNFADTLLEHVTHSMSPFEKEQSKHFITECMETVKKYNDMQPVFTSGILMLQNAFEILKQTEIEARERERRGEL